MWFTLAFAQDTVLTLDGAVPDDGADFARVSFEVPAGTVELEIEHLSTGDSVLDWGLIGADGTTRGWGGGNSENVTIGTDAASRSYLPGIEPGTWQVVIGKARMTEDPAPYTLSVTLKETATLQRRVDRGDWQPPPALESLERWYAGDFHVHSLESGDARASLDQIADLARDRGLDFVVITDHNTVSQVDFLASAQSRHPDVLFIPGMELTTYRGHLGLIGTTGYHDHGIQAPFDLEQLIEDVHAEGGLVSINHPALALGGACIGCAWEPDLTGLSIDAVEIQTGGLEPVGGLFTDAAIAFWEELDVAAIGGSDDHRAGIELGGTESPIGSPTTMVYATELSVAGILEGVRQKRTVVKLQDPDDPLVTLESLPGAVRIGSNMPAELRLIYNREVLYTNDTSVQVPVDPGWIVRLEGWVGGERRSVSSSVVVGAVSEPPEEPGCGCTSTPSPWAGSLWRRR